MRVGVLVAVGEPFLERDPQDIAAILSSGLNGILTASHNAAALEKGIQSLVQKESQNLTADGDSEGWSFLHNGEAHIRLLIGVPLSTLRDAIFDLLSATDVREKIILHAGCTAEGSGNWLLKDSALKAEAFIQTLNRAAISLTAAGQSLGLTLFWKETAQWSLNHIAKSAPGVDLIRGILISGQEPPAVTALRGLVQQALSTSSMDPAKMLSPSRAIGKIRFPRPTVYVFPAGEGTCALFGMTSFSLLLEGGYGKKTSAWNLIRHLDGVDLLLVPHFTPETVNPVTSLLGRQRVSPTDTFPQLGCIFANTPPRVVDKMVHGDPLVISAFDSVESLSRDLSDLQMKPRNLLVSLRPGKKAGETVLEPIPLYHKVGHGKLLMFVLNPMKESSEYKSLQEGWKRRDASVSLKKNGTPPLTALSSAAVLIVWLPENPLDPPVRFLYPGQAPQQRILTALEKMKSFDFMKTPFKAGPNPCTKPITVPDTASNTSSLAPSPASAAFSPSPETIPGNDSTNLSQLRLHSLMGQKPDEGLHEGALDDSTFLCGASDIPLLQHLSPVGPSDRDDLFGPVSGVIRPDQVLSPSGDAAFGRRMSSENFLDENSLASKRNGGGNHVVAFAPSTIETETVHQTGNGGRIPGGGHRSEELSLEDLKKELGRPLGLPMPTQPKAPAPTSRSGARRPRMGVSSPAEGASRSGSATTGRPAEMTTSRRRAPAPARGAGTTRPEPTSRVAGARSGVAEKGSRGPPPPAKSAGSAVGRKPNAPVSQKPALSAPVYLDMAYIPLDATEDFFRLVRSRNYVISGLDPGAEVLSSFLKGKKSWGKSNLEVELVPVYDAASLHLWMALNRDELDKESINIAPSAARCTVSLENDLGTCAAYRMELG